MNHLKYHMRYRMAVKVEKIDEFQLLFYFDFNCLPLELTKIVIPISLLITPSAVRQNKMINGSICRHPLRFNNSAWILMQSKKNSAHKTSARPTIPQTASVCTGCTANSAAVNHVTLSSMLSIIFGSVTRSKQETAQCNHRLVHFM